MNSSPVGTVFDILTNFPSLFLFNIPMLLPLSMHYPVNMIFFISHKSKMNCFHFRFGSTVDADLANEVIVGATGSAKQPVGGRQCAPFSIYARLLCASNAWI